MREPRLIPTYSIFGYDAGKIGKLLTFTANGLVVPLINCIFKGGPKIAHFANAADAIRIADKVWPHHWRVALSYNIEEEFVFDARSR